MFDRLKIKLLLNSIYYSQIDDFSERFNQTIEIVLRYLIFENLNID